MIAPKVLKTASQNTIIEDDLAGHHIRTFFSAFGNIKSIVCVYRSRCAFINFASHTGAEAAAESCQGKAVITGCPSEYSGEAETAGEYRPLTGGGDASRIYVSRFAAFTSMKA